MIEAWSKLLAEGESFKGLRDLVRAFESACHLDDIVRVHPPPITRAAPSNLRRRGYGGKREQPPAASAATAQRRRRVRSDGYRGAARRDIPNLTLAPPPPPAAAAAAGEHAGQGCGEEEEEGGGGGGGGAGVQVPHRERRRLRAAHAPLRRKGPRLLRPVRRRPAPRRPRGSEISRLAPVLSRGGPFL